MYGILTFLYPYVIIYKFYKEIGVSRKCSIVLLVMPEEHHKRTILQRLLTLLYIIHHLILRATKFLQEQLKRTCGYIVCPIHNHNRYFVMENNFSSLKLVQVLPNLINYHGNLP